MHLARAAARGERHEVALDAYRHVTELEPENVAARLGAAASLLRTRRLDDAAALARAVVDAATAEPVQTAEAHELLARVALGRRDHDAAREEAQRAEGDDPGRPVRAFVEGRIALDENRLEDAATSFSAALDSASVAGRPPLTDLRVNAAETFVRLQRLVEAEALFEAELQAFPANARARAGLQAVYRSTGRSADGASVAQH
jgi:tetratricopeptide (TPR) repeat protein